MRLNQQKPNWHKINQPNTLFYRISSY